MLITLHDLSSKRRRATDKILLLQVMSNYMYRCLSIFSIFLLCVLNRSNLGFHPLTDVLFPPHPGSNASVMQPHLVLLVETNLFIFFPPLFFLFIPRRVKTKWNIWKWHKSRNGIFKQSILTTLKAFVCMTAKWTYSVVDWNSYIVMAYNTPCDERMHHF